MPTTLLNTWLLCVISLEEEINQFNITIMSYKIHKIQGSVVAKLPGKIPKTLNASKI